MLKILQLLNIGRTVTPETKMKIAELLNQLAADAARTPGSADDTAVALLCAICTILGLY